MKNLKTNNVIKNILGLTLTATMTLMSCSNDDLQENAGNLVFEAPPEEEVVVSLSQEDFILNREEAKQTFTIDSEAGGIVVGEEGTELHFNPNSFNDADGSPVTGDVTIELIEIYTKGDMLLMDMPTNGKRPNGDVETLISGGEFFVNATKDGEQLNPNGGFMLVAPAANDEFDADMRVFNGMDSDCDGIGNCSDQDDDIIWEEDQQNGLEPRDGGGPDGSYSVGYSTFISQFGWTNIDKWYSDPRPKTTIYVDVPEGYDNTNSAVYISYDGEPTALGNMDVWDTDEEMFTEHYGLIPIGLEVHFIFLSQHDGEWNYAIHSATIEENHIECFCDPVEIDGISEDDLIDIINNLP